MEHEISYGLKKTLRMSVDDAEAHVRGALADEGFGVLTEIDVKATMKAKLDVDFRPYKILGACNPTLAHRALIDETDIGLLLPCNVIVAGNEDGTAVVSILDPAQQLAVAGREDMQPLAAEVLARMQRVVQAL
jgi:uncharacterized protein (DUF302 family)